VHLVENANPESPAQLLRPSLEQEFSADFLHIESTTDYPPQRRAYSLCIKRYRERFNWIAFFDLDEFLTVLDTCGTHILTHL
jgi:Glycosyltransferase family 92